MIAALEFANAMTLPDQRVLVAGDWHGNVRAIQKALPAARRAFPGVETLLHVGDFWTDTKPVDYWCARTGIRRVLVTLGNHEPYNAYRSALEAHPGSAVRISEAVWLLPRPYRFLIGGRQFLSVGGAASVDRELRTPGVDWFPEEQITDGHVAAASNGTADVMIAHETPELTPVEEVQAHINRRADIYPERGLAESQISRNQVQRVWDAVRPRLLVHGHMHVAGTGATADGRVVVSLPRDGQPGNIALLDLAELTVTPNNHA